MPCAPPNTSRIVYSGDVPMSPNTMPIAPTTRGIIGREPVAELAKDRLNAAFVGAPGEPDVQLLQLPVQVRALEARFFGDPAHVALLAAEQLLEIDALEGLA